MSTKGPPVEIDTTTPTSTEQKKLVAGGLKQSSVKAGFCQPLLKLKAMWEACQHLRSAIENRLKRSGPAL